MRRRLDSHTIAEPTPASLDALDDLIQCAQRGEESAFVELMDRFEGKALMIARGMGASRSDAPVTNAVGDRSGLGTRYRRAVVGRGRSSLGFRGAVDRFWRTGRSILEDWSIDSGGLVDRLWRTDRPMLEE